MTLNFFKSSMWLLFVTTVFVSCENTPDEAPLQTEKSPPAKEMTVLGKKLPNPHDPVVVKQAFENLKKSNPNLVKDVAMDFAPTHIYVKFSPKDQDELNELKQMYGFDLDNIPAFYEYEKFGNYYHDPSIDKDMPTYQYATLAVGTKLPNTIKHDVLEQMILLDLTEKVDNKLKYSEAFYEAFYYELYSITKMTKLVYGNNAKRALWRPSGELKQRLLFDNGTIVDNADIGRKVQFLDFWSIPLPSQVTRSWSDGRFFMPNKFLGGGYYKVFYPESNTYVSSLRNGSELRLRCYYDEYVFVPGRYTTY